MCAELAPASKVCLLGRRVGALVAATYAADPARAATLGSIFLLEPVRRHCAFSTGLTTCRKVSGLLTPWLLSQKRQRAQCERPATVLSDAMGLGHQYGSEIDSTVGTHTPALA